MTLLNIKTISGGAAVIVIILLVSLAQEMNRRLQVQREVVKLEQQVQQVEKNVIELENLNQYFRTPDFQERLAREKLNFQAPGEQAVYLPQPGIEEENTIKSSTPLQQYSIPEQWWRAFFFSPNSTE